MGGFTVVCVVVWFVWVDGFGGWWFGLIAVQFVGFLLVWSLLCYLVGGVCFD